MGEYQHRSGVMFPHIFPFLSTDSCSSTALPPRARTRCHLGCNFLGSAWKNPQGSHLGKGSKEPTDFEPPLILSPHWKRTHRFLLPFRLSFLSRNSSKSSTLTFFSFDQGFRSGQNHSARSSDNKYEQFLTYTHLTYFNLLNLLT